MITKSQISAALDDRHFVRETENSPYEKLKVSPWFDKPKAKQHMKWRITKW